MQRLVLEMSVGGNDAQPTAEEWLRRNVVELMRFYRMRQAELAGKIGRSQSWLSRRLSGKPWTDGGSRFQLADLDALASAFGLSPAELLEPKYGEWDRRTGQDRRIRTDRRHKRPPLRDPDTGDR